MILGIGVDIVEIARIKRVAERNARFARKVLADTEYDIYVARGGAASAQAIAYLAKRFAAKEAFFKALGEPSSAANTWHELSIANDPAGRPEAHTGRLLTALLNKKRAAIWVSLSDEKRYAVAQIVLEKR
jgi:holo-[acyl-carrier protein] synthase